MREYIELIRTILESGSGKDDRTGVGNVGIVGAQMRTNLQEGFPALNIRKVAPRIAFEELIFMLNGYSDTKILEDKDINIWKGNTSAEFQEKVGLSYLEEGDMGRMYGVQMRDFNGIDDVGEPMNFDQLKYVIDELRYNKLSRRIIISQYNPAEANQGVLFPCHIMIQFIVTDDNKLNCVYWMRSSDTIFGLPYNHMYYAFFTHMLAEMCRLEVGDLVYQAGDSHIYNNQIKMAEDMLVRSVKDEYLEKERPHIELKKPIFTINDMLSYEWEDVIIHGYNPMPDFKDKPPMAV